MKDISACSNFPHIIGFNYKDFSEEFSKHKISWDFEVFWLLTNIWNSTFKWNFCHNWVSISRSCSIWEIFDTEQYCVQRHLGRVTQFLRHGSFRLRFISWEIDTSHHAPLSRNIWTWTAYFFCHQNFELSSKLVYWKQLHIYLKNFHNSYSCLGFDHLLFNVSTLNVFLMNMNIGVQARVFFSQSCRNYRINGLRRFHFVALPGYKEEKTL